ncbi:MAG: phenylalanine--tRNA ligase subunit beta [Patescibacteria group bacterium]|jgi:phenylalanyl-tRNA synthetase beta chain
MLISLNWLKKFIDIPKGFTPQDLAAKLTMSTVEVEGIKKQGELLDNVVVAKILEIKAHPNADKLKIVTVDTGSDKLEVVCGGINLRNEMVVAFARVGAFVRWHGEAEVTELKPAKIRGVESAGMICASEEIGIDGAVPCGEAEVADLTNLNLEIGQPLAEALGLDDVILEVDNKSMSNRPDLWGHYGIARELSALLKIDLQEYKTPEIKGGRGKKLKVEIKDKDKCPRYIGVIIEGIKIAPSPAWMAKLLEAAGVRPINNIVDITNYVMLELGQPMHAFDLRKVSGATIVVETAERGEKFVTLDGVERDLDEDMLLIKDAKKGVALAGIMGGENSEIKDDTTAVLFEAANFKASNIRQTSMKLGLRSESSARFEKGLDPLLAETAMQRAVELVKEFIPEAKISGKVVDENNYEFKAPEIDLDLGWLNNRLGTALTKEDVLDILQRLNFEIKEKKDQLTIVVPSWRATGDVSITEDLLEEVARIYGYDNIKSDDPVLPMSLPQENRERTVERKIKDILVGPLAFTESYNYSFVDKNKVGNLGLLAADHIELANSLSEEQGLLRNSLIPNLVKNVADNLRFYDSFKLFELDSVFIKNLEGQYIKIIGQEEKLPFQEKYLSGVAVEAGNDQPFYIVKGVVESLLDQLRLDYFWQVPKNIPAWCEKTRAMQVVVRGKVLGLVGELARTVADKVDIKPAVGIFELNAEMIANVYDDNKVYEEISKYPSVLRDLAIVLPDGTTWEDVKKAVKKVGGELVSDIELFDVYQGDKIEAGHKSLAFHLVFSLPDRTLTAEEVGQVEKKVVTELGNKFKARVR